MTSSELRDGFDRHIHYLRLSITDRCDFRCLYCMSDDMRFLPRKDILSLEELVRVSQAFVDMGVTKIRVTGGEPLIRNDALLLLQSLGKMPELKSLCLTTNGSRVKRYAKDLFDAGVGYLNISLDTLNADRFKQMTRHGDLQTVLEGIQTATQYPFQKIKINSVLMRHFNIDEICRLTEFALNHDCDISFIEEMPLGEIASHDRSNEFISSAEVRNILKETFDLSETNASTGGPSRYWSVAGHKNKIGFISPHSENFCNTCNRVRVTASGRLLLCLGNEDSVDLKKVLRHNESDVAIKSAIEKAMTVKPEKHEFNLSDTPQILRFMNTTGG